MDKVGQMIEQRADLFCRPIGDQQVYDRRQRVENFFRAALLGDPKYQNELKDRHCDTGGYLVPDDFRSEVMARLPEACELFPYVRVVPVSREHGIFPVARSDGTIDNVTYQPGRLSITMAVDSDALVGAGRPLSDFIMSIVIEVLAPKLDELIAVGGGYGGPSGIVSAVPRQTVSLGKLDYKKLQEIEELLPAKYRRNARWLLNEKNLRRIKGIKDTETDKPAFERDPYGRREDTILGYRFSLQNAIPDAQIYFGDLRYYLWFDWEQMGVESTMIASGDPFQKHKRYISLWIRADGRIGLHEAFSAGINLKD